MIIKNKRIRTILAISKTEFWSIILYSTIVGGFSLIIPIAAQSLVNFVSFGHLTQPLFTLGFAVFIALTFAAVFRIMQIILVENIQQRILTYNAVSFAKNIPDLKSDVFETSRGTELTNRFFDLFTLQKTISLILISGAGLVLQALFGMILLAFYHPLLLLFDVILLSSLAIVIWLPWKGALKTALDESDAKYDIAGWLEELARLPSLFKFNNYMNYAFQVADEKIANYLIARQSHFRKILFHVIGNHFIQIFSVISLLILGGLLVINNQLTLGQLVAAEIVVSAIGNSAIMFSKYLEDIYDLLAAAVKVDYLLDLPTEEHTKMNENNNKSLRMAHAIQSPPAIRVHQLSFAKYDNAIVFKNLSFSINAKEHLVIYGENGKGKTLISKLLVGLCKPSSGEIFYDSVSLFDYSLKIFRSKISYVNGIEYFDGSIIDNLTLSHQQVDLGRIWEVLDHFSLADKIRSLPNGIHTFLNDSHHDLTDTDFRLLMIARAILSDPYLIIIDEIIDFIPKKNLNVVLELLLQKENTWTLVLTTSQQDIAAQFKNRVTL